VRRIVVLKLDCHVGETSLAPDKVERIAEQSNLSNCLQCRVIGRFTRSQ
jgi:hypothetical protein